MSNKIRWYEKHRFIQSFILVGIILFVVAYLFSLKGYSEGVRTLLCGLGYVCYGVAIFGMSLHVQNGKKSEQGNNNAVNS